MFSSIVS